MYKTYCLYPQGYSPAPSMFNRGCLLAFKRQARGFQHKEIWLGFNFESHHCTGKFFGKILIPFNSKIFVLINKIPYLQCIFESFGAFTSHLDNYEYKEQRSIIEKCLVYLNPALPIQSQLCLPLDQHFMKIVKNRENFQIRC